MNKVVDLEVVAPDVIHSWWIPALGGKIDAIPGRTNHTWFRGRAGRGRSEAAAPSSAAPSTPHDRLGQSRERARQFTQFLATHSASSRHGRQGDVRGRLREVPRHRRRGNRRARLAIAGRQFDATTVALIKGGGRDMPAVGEDWSDEHDRRDDRVPQQVDRGAPSGRGSTNRTGARLEAGRRHELADDDRPQADRDPLHRHEPRVLRHRRAARAAHPPPAREPRPGLHHGRQVQRALHDPRHGDGLPRGRADPRRLRQLPRAAHDRRARHGVPQAERPLVLALPPRRARALRELLREGRGVERGLDGVSTAVRDASTAPATVSTSGSCRSTC